MPASAASPDSTSIAALLYSLCFSVRNAGRKKIMPMKANMRKLSMRSPFTQLSLASSYSIYLSCSAVNGLSKFTFLVGIYKLSVQEDRFASERYYILCHLHPVLEKHFCYRPTNPSRTPLSELAITECIISKNLDSKKSKI